MSDDTSTGARRARGDRGEVLAELGLPLEELVRRGARDILQRAIEAEVEQLLEEFAGVSLMDGRRAVVRNGYLPAREILTTVGPVEVQVPKVRDRSGAGVKFNSALAPPYVRRSARVAAALPWLYLKGISSGDLGEALEVLVGEDAKGLSAAALGRLKAAWAEEYKDWTQRSLEGRQYAYWWVDGIYTTLRESDDPKLCLLVIIGVRPDGTKEWVAIVDGLRESTESWLDVLRDLKARGLQAGPRLAVGDGALGFWGALEQVYPETVHQRCWFHKMGNVLNALPKSLQGKAKADLQAIWMAPTRKQATQAFKRFISRYGAKYPKATEKLEKDREALLAFFAFPAEHWVHLRTTNPIESTFATVRHRTGRTKNCVTRATFLGLAFKMSEEAAKTWRRIRAPEKVAELLGGTRYEDGIPVSDDPPETQEEQREAA
ncbi:IS256 family transposase [Thiocapsa bogorovii]|uniref:IS256 family transposase n=1 Tax=Thiocapsa bogorovii TaxID=521689 RepID=UPI001E52E2FE|nr:IS256 family transposase [Thiocapsa bogorovii]UHD14597.1 IS256 family transposase [Thiocapsa bogorovii]